MNINENNKEIADSKNVAVSDDWYKLSNKKICSILETNPQTGLSNHEAKLRLEKYGKNNLPKSKKPNWSIIFLKSFLDPLSLIMILSGLASGLAICNFTKNWNSWYNRFSYYCNNCFN